MKRQRLRFTHAKGELRLLQQIMRLIPSHDLDSRLQDAVLVCIDCEAYELEQDKVTEIGVAIVDTKGLDDMTGEDAEDWMNKIKHAHYRLREHAHLLNRRFVKGCEDGFNFGETTWISIEDAPEILGRIFSSPTHLAQAADLEVEVPDDKRNVVLVGHGLSSDKGYLGQLGFSATANTNIVRSFDTQMAAGGTKKAQVSLWKLLLSLGVQPVNLHNAGNDAAYALQVLLIMALKDYEEPGSVFTALEQHNGTMRLKTSTAPQAHPDKSGAAAKSTTASNYGKLIEFADSTKDSEPSHRGQKRAADHVSVDQDQSM